MSYQPDKLVGLAVELLRNRPRLTASEVSARLLVHRHTLHRALKAGGHSFASIRQGLVLERLHVHLTSDQTTSLKEVRAGLGFASASSFARYIRRAPGKSPTEYRSWLHVGPNGAQKGQNES